MSFRTVSINKVNLKSKRKRNQFVNEFLKRNYPDLLISRREFIKRHKEEVVNIFNNFGWNQTAQMYATDCLGSCYWYNDPICYKTNLDNLDFTDFNEKFIELFGKDILNNKFFLRKINALKHGYLNSGYK